MPAMAEQRVALVTGGAKRVGRAIVERLAHAGFDVAFTYLTSESDAAELRSQLESNGSNALAIKADLTHAQRAADTITRAFAGRFDRLDVLVNSASLYEPAPLDKTDLVLSRRMMAIHFESPLLLCQAFAPLLRRSKGHVVNMLDLLAERPWPQYVAYCASKAALWNLTLSLARELAPDVTVNGIAPGVVEWPPDYPESEQQKYLKRVPLARAGSPRDVAETVHFLATAGDYVTGQVIRLDGGRSIT
jgi:pteridine reductase